jgi:hypothetical protein
MRLNPSIHTAAAPTERNVTLPTMLSMGPNRLITCPGEVGVADQGAADGGHDSKGHH